MNMIDEMVLEAKAVLAKTIEESSARATADIRNVIFKRNIFTTANGTVYIDGFAYDNNGISISTIGITSVGGNSDGILTTSLQEYIKSNYSEKDLVEYQFILINNQISELQKQINHLTLQLNNKIGNI